MITTQQVMDVLKSVYDPDYVDKSIIDMGLVRPEDVVITPDHIEVQYGLTAPLCPFSAAIGLLIKYALEKKLNTQVTVNLRPDHRQGKLVKEVLQDPSKASELMAKLHQFGIIEKCVKV